MPKKDTLRSTTVIVSWAIAIILVALPFHAFFTTWLGSNFNHLDLIRIWKELLIVAIAIPAIWVAWTSKPLRQWLLNSWITRLFALYVLIHLILGLWAYTDHQVTKTALIYALLINLRFIGFFIICYIVASRDKFLFTNWQKILLIPAGVVIVFGLLQQFVLPYDFLKHFGYGPSTIPAYQTVDSDINYQRIQSTLRGANPLGAYLVLIIPALLFVKNQFLKIAGLIGGFLCLFYSYSRSAWLGTTTALFIIGLLHFGFAKRTKEVIAVVGILIALACIGVYALRGNHSAQDALFHTSSTSTSVSSNAQRSKAIKDAAKDVYHQPQGRGPGTAGPASFRNQGHTTRIAENYYLQIAQEVGIIGLLIFLAINAVILLQLWGRRYELLPQILLASFIGISLVNLVSHAWTDDTLSLLWWGLAGISLANYKSKDAASS